MYRVQIQVTLVKRWTDGSPGGDLIRYYVDDSYKSNMGSWFGSVDICFDAEKGGESQPVDFVVNIRV